MVGAYRLVLLGSGGVGKSALLARFLDGLFDPRYHPTVDEFDRRTIQLPDGEFHSVEFLDTAGLHQFPAMRRLSILTGGAFVIVYSIDSYTTFNDALCLADLVHEIKGHEQIPIILVGNKSDLEDTRVVPTAKAQNEAVSRNCAFIETSAKTNENVRELFMELMVKIFKVTPEMTLKNRKSKKRRRHRRKAVDKENNNNDVISSDSRCSVM